MSNERPATFTVNGCGLTIGTAELVPGRNSPVMALVVRGTTTPVALLHSHQAGSDVAQALDLLLRAAAAGKLDQELEPFA